MKQISFINQIDGLIEEGEFVSSEDKVVGKKNSGDKQKFVSGFTQHEIKQAANAPMEQSWSPPASFPEHYKSAEFIAIDLETCDPNLTTKGPGWCRDDGFIVGIALAFNDFYGYFPIKHEGGGNMPMKPVMNFVKDVMATDIPKVMHNAQYDMGWLRWAGIQVNGPIYDTMVAGAMLDENRWSYALNNLARDYIGEGKSEAALRRAAADWGVDPKAEMWKLPAYHVGQYAEQDAKVTLSLWNRLRPLMEQQEVWHIFKMESELIHLLLDMRWKGVRVDLEGADKARQQLKKEEHKLHMHIKELTGMHIEPWNANSIAEAYDKMGLPYNRTATDQPSFTKQFLAQSNNELAQSILRLREYNKANTTFINNIFKFEHNGRIQCEFHPLRSDDGGTVTGRFSSSNPNLQQIPARDPVIKKIIRGLFVPDEGAQWGSFDYASQEPRWLAHYCGSLAPERRHSQIDGVIKKYHEDDADFHQMVADMAGISRKDAKTVNLGIMYGMGVNKLSAVLGVEVDEAKELLANYHEKVPFVKGLADEVSNRAQQVGAIRTYLGRRCRFDLWEPKAYGLNKALPLEEAQKEYGNRGMLRRAYTYKALNRLIQGSSADQMKKAMLDCYKEGLVPLLTVHDELCFNVYDDGQKERIREIMEHCVEALVPFKVDVALGSNWGEID